MKTLLSALFFVCYGLGTFCFAVGFTGIQMFGINFISVITIIGGVTWAVYAGKMLSETELPIVVQLGFLALATIASYYFVVY